MAKKILFTSPGRRFELINFFKEEFNGYEFIGADAFKTSPAAFILDRVYEVALKIDEHYIDEVIEVCKKEKPEFVIPLLDPELPQFAKNKKRFEEIDVHVWVPDYDIVELSNDKYLTYTRFQNTGIDLPKTWLLRDYLSLAELPVYEKLVLKPSKGSASKGIYKINSQEVKALSNSEKLDVETYLVQENIQFDFEVTVDLFGDGNGNVVEYCQRKRISTRGGEVEKGITVNLPKVTELVRKVVGDLKILGVVNIQVMVKNDKVYLGEINPRFGGGYPLAHKAGANLIQHIKSYMNKIPYENIGDSRYKEDFYMLRYDKAVYTDKLLDLV
ncbi:MAG: ATP-grasp domain-containing protein [Ignavibacteria bacterium]|nr:ATP-grasp domain-containing protein [Ignavibacteria bacterium]